MAEYADFLVNLAEILKRLRTTYSGRDLEQLENATGLQRKTLISLESGTEMLSWEVTCAYVAACGGDKGAVRRVWEDANDAQEGPEEERRWRTRGNRGQIGKWKRHDTVGRLPSPTDARNSTELAKRLLKLKEWAGNPTLNEFEKRTQQQVNDSTLSEIFKHRPDRLTPDRAEQIAAACGLPPWEAIPWRETAAKVKRPSIPPIGNSSVAEPITESDTERTNSSDTDRSSSQSSGFSGWRPNWREKILFALVVTFAILYGRTLLDPPSPYYQVQLTQQYTEAVDQGSPITVPLNLPSMQNWYLDIRLNVGWKQPGLSTCRQDAEATYYVTGADKKELTKPTKVIPAALPKDNQTEPVEKVHLGWVGGQVNIIVRVSSDDQCELTLNLAGTTAHT